ncbi:MAG: helix-turn-helix transcriptional regulator [Magnetococcales bacterium]|nr:helix-turn-helix transcriptional regulator [Magnetococcales bacterium]
MNFFERLKTERKRLGLTQGEMADIGGISKTSYFNYESGSREPNASFLTAIATAGVDVNYVLTGVQAISGQHSRDFEDYPEIGTALVLDVVLFIETWLTDSGKTMPPDKKVAMVKAMCRFLVTEDRNSKPTAKEGNESNVIKMERVIDFLKVASA